MNNTNMPQSYQFSLVPGVSQQPRQSQPPITTAHHSPARLVAANETVMAYQKSASQIYQRRQLSQQRQMVIRQATVIQTKTLAPTVLATHTQATPAQASVPQARTFNRLVYLDNRGSTVPSALRARLAGRHVAATLHFGRDGTLRGYSYRHDESVLGPVNEWRGAASGHGLFTI